ncbi:hypothetical protein L198_03346 [Cryptococcus wingfieldii CBS 7118]|uniref:Bromo domain-containing protein n=1 Tax=Cryptococcus wingfieldii CBS 7118 TaxID=1295528 RepID=A0A1E3JF92_9TREE|nr:hypothetical protein L198_03346 [Cryptococcus wingfieldii CBS 7118]ODN99502.1 hypothetical protein L198_03346 [Cryptococcus wingfieldii CBS 7118]
MGAKRKSSARQPPAISANHADSQPPLPSESVISDDPSASTTADNRLRKRKLDVNPSLIIPADGGRSMRRRSPSPHVAKQEGNADADPKDPARAKELGMRIWQKIMEAQTKDGEPMAEPFVKLPPKRQFPDYYETIKHPMSLEIVKQRLDKQEYDTLKDVVADIGQIFNNAKRYNVRESALFQWAKKLHATKEDSDSEGDEQDEFTSEPVHRERTETLPPDADGSSAREDEDDAKLLNKKKKGPYVAREGPTVYKLIKPVLKAIKEAKAYDGSGRLISDVFMQLPDRKDLPDYYKTIKTPISLEEIEAKHSGRRYETWEEFFDDLELMCNNAMEYNTDESAVFQDAKRIKDMFPQQRAETKLRLTLPPGTKLSARQKASAMIPVRVANPHLGYAPSTATVNSPVTATMPMSGHMTARGSHGFPGQIPTPSPGAHHSIPQTAYPAPSPSYSQSPYHGSHSLPRPGMSHTSSSSYLPALPLGVVTEEVVASLDRYPVHEQQQWLNSLPPHGVATYRSLNVVVEQKKRQAAAQAQARAQAEAQAQVQAQNAARVQAQAHAQAQAMYQSFSQTQTPSHVPSPSPAARSGASTPALPTPQAERRPPPPQPLISHLDLSYTSPSAFGSQQQIIKLRNSRGVVAHSILLDCNTSELEIAAYPDLALAAERGDQQDEQDMTLHLNGVVSSTGRVVEKEGMKWTVAVPLSKNENRIEVAVGKGGSQGETVIIYLNRQ